MNNRSSSGRVLGLVGSAAFIVISVLSARPVATSAQSIQMQVRTVTGGPSGPATGAPTMSPIDQSGTGLIVGQVVDADSNRPIAGAIVAIGGAGAARRSVMSTASGNNAPPTPAAAAEPAVLTDSDGRFAFNNLPRGSFNLMAVKSGYVSGAYGRLRPDGSSQSLDLDDGERRGDVKIRLFKYAAISGTLVDESNEPIVGAQVVAYRRNLAAGRRLLSASGIPATTDDRGMYRLGGLSPGEYLVAVPNTQTSVPASFKLQGPIQPDLMTTLSGPSGGFSIGTGGSPVTPDGKFLLQNTGRTVTPTTPGGRLMVYATQYFPNAATTQQATAITLASGEERSGVDMQLRLVPALNIAGRLLGPDGPVVNWGLHLVPGDTADLSADPDVATSITDADGQFMFLAVPAGQYVIETTRVPRVVAPAGSNMIMLQSASGIAYTTSVNLTSTTGPATPPPLPTDPTLWVSTPVSLGEDDLTDLTLNVRTGFKISGRLEFKGSATIPTPDQLVTIPVRIEPADAKQRTSATTGRVDADGTFTTIGLLPGKYLVRIGGAPSGWTFKSSMLGGADVSDTPLEISDHDITGVVIGFGTTPTDLQGTVRSPDGVSDDSSAVVVFPADNRAWLDYGLNPRRVRSTRTSKTGTFDFGALPVGEYYLAAFSEEYAGEWQDPHFLELLARTATHVTLGDGDKRSVDLTRQTIRPGGLPPEPAPYSHDVDSTSGPFVPTSDELLQAPPPPVRDPGPRRPQTQAPPQTVPPQTAPPRDAGPAKSGNGAIAGVVTLDDPSEQPMRHARVTLRAADATSERTVTTDDAGRFAFAELPAGTYTLSAAKAAYVTTFYGSKHPGRGPGIPISIANGETMSDVRLAVPRGGVITGTALDDYGAPVSNARVILLQYRNLTGERALTPVPGPTAPTDDRGVYRIYGLAPGSYAVGIVPPPTLQVFNQLRQLSASDLQAALTAVQQSGAASSVASTPAYTSAMSRPTAPPEIGTALPARPGRTVGYSNIYYPGTWSMSDAQMLTLTAGQELTGIDLPVHLLPTSRLDGRVTGADGQPAQNFQIMLVPLSANPFGAGPFGSIRSNPDGAFFKDNVTPGRYLLMARAGARGGPIAQPTASLPPPGPPDVPQPGVGFAGGGQAVFMQARQAMTLYAQQELDVNGEDVTGVTLTLQEGMTLSGRIAFEAHSKTPPTDLTRISVLLTPAGSQGVVLGVPPAEVSASGEFQMAGITPGQYRLVASAPASTGWTLKSSLVDGRDTLDEALEIRPGQNVTGAVVTLTDQMAELSGRLLDTAGKPAPGYTILLFPTDRSQWTTGSRRMPQPMQPASDGTFRARGLPAGEYYLAAVTDLDTTQDWGDPTYMEQVVPGALKITLKDGEQRVQDLKLAKQ